MLQENIAKHGSYSTTPKCSASISGRWSWPGTPVSRTVYLLLQLAIIDSSAAVFCRTGCIDDEFVGVEAQHDRDPIVNRDPIEDPVRVFSLSCVIQRSVAGCTRRSGRDKTVPSSEFLK